MEILEALTAFIENERSNGRSTSYEQRRQFLVSRNYANSDINYALLKQMALEVKQNREQRGTQ